MMCVFLGRSRLSKSQAINHEAKTIVSHLKGQLDALAAHVTGNLPYQFTRTHGSGDSCSSTCIGNLQSRRLRQHQQYKGITSTNMTPPLDCMKPASMEEIALALLLYALSKSSRCYC